MVCPVYERACDPDKAPYAIFLGIDNDRSFRTVVLFFHILSHLGMEGIAADLATAVTGCDTISADEIFLQHEVTESMLRKLERVSLRLGLAEVFSTIERTDTEKRVLGDLKAILGDPYGEKCLCQLLKQQEDEKKICYQNCEAMMIALETCELVAGKEDLEDFFERADPFLSK